MNRGAVNFEKFGDAKFAMRFEFLGHFILMDNFDDPDAVLWAYAGIAYTRNCQLKGPGHKTAYFYVSAFRETGANKFLDVEKNP